MHALAVAAAVVRNTAVYFVMMTAASTPKVGIYARVVAKMGLDAFVVCNCFKEGKLSSPPEPFTIEDIYRDEEGYISSRMLNGYYKQLGYSDYMARYEALDDRFRTWAEHACEHEDGEYFSECVSNWQGVRQFQAIVRELGSEERYPALSKLIPQSNGGNYPAELAAKAIEEIDDLIEAARGLVFSALVCEGFNEPIWTCANRDVQPMMMGPHIEAGMEGDAVYFICDGRKLMSRRFRQEPVGTMRDGGNQEMEITLCETDKRVRVFDSIGPHGTPKVAREFWVEPREAPFMYEGHYYTAERIRSLLAASVETGNPIQWC